MPLRVIKHKITCPLDLNFYSSLIGRNGILVIPGNHLGSETLLLCASHANNPYFKIFWKDSLMTLAPPPHPTSNIVRCYPSTQFTTPALLNIVIVHHMFQERALSRFRDNSQKSNLIILTHNDVIGMAFMAT